MELSSDGRISAYSHLKELFIVAGTIGILSLFSAIAVIIITILK